VIMDEASDWLLVDPVVDRCALPANVCPRDRFGTRSGGLVTAKAATYPSAAFVMTIFFDLLQPDPSHGVPSVGMRHAVGHSSEARRHAILTHVLLGLWNEGLALVASCSYVLQA
jgi:hypothetical protein